MTDSKDTMAKPGIVPNIPFTETICYFYELV
jgi:hypothetical protein